MKNQNLSKRIMAMGLSFVMATALLPTLPARAWVSDNGDGTYSNPGMYGDYPDNDVIRVGDTYYMSSTSMHLFPACPIMSSKDLVNWEYESYALPDEALLAIAGNGNGLELKNGRNVYDRGPWASSLRYSEKLQKFYLLINMQDGVDAEYAVLCVADSAKGPWAAYRLDNPTGAIKGLYDPGLFFDRDPVTGEENGKIYVVHGQGRLYVSELEVVDPSTGELKICDDEAKRNQPIYNYTGGSYNEGSHAYKYGDTYYILSTPTWSGTSTKKDICIQTKDLLHGPYAVRDIITTYTNSGDNGIHQGGIVDVPQGDGTSEWWSIIFQDHNKLGRFPTLQPVYWEKDEDGLRWPIMGVQGQNGEQGVVTMTKPNTGASTQPAKPRDSDEFSDSTLGLHWQWNHIADAEKWSLTEREGYMRLHTATVTTDLSKAQNTLRQRVVGPESAATIKLDIDHMADGDVAGLSVIQHGYNYIGVKNDAGDKRVLVSDNGSEMISADIPDDTATIWFKAHTPRFEYRTEYFYSLDGENFVQLGGRYNMHMGNYVGMGFGAFNFATKALGGYVDMDYFHMEMPDDHGNYRAPGEKIDAEFYDVQSYDRTLGSPSRNYNPLTKYTADDAYTESVSKGGDAYNLTVANLHEGDWVQYNRVDFGTGADWLNVRVSGIENGGKLELRKGGADGELLATVNVPNTGSLEQFENVFVPVDGNDTGIQKICLVYRGSGRDTCRINWFMLGAGTQPEAPEAPESLSARGAGNTQVTFSWADVPGALGYDLQIGGRIISNVTSPFTETGLPEGAVYKVSIRAKNDGGYSEWSEGVRASTGGNPYVIPQGNMSIQSCSSDNPGDGGSASGMISAILDGNAGTYWHSRWTVSTPPPHWFILDLGQNYEIDQITMLPRQGGGPPNGHIYEAELSCSATGTADGDFTKFATYSNTTDTSLQTLTFEPVTARYVKVFVTKGHNNFASLAEINVYRTEADDTAPTAPADLAAHYRYEEDQVAVTLTWTAAADVESGVGSYSVYRDGRFLDAVKGTEYVDEGLAVGESHTYEVLATNGAGLDGPKSEALNVTVPDPAVSYKIPQSRLAATASSEEPVVDKGDYGYIANLLDGNAGTFWSVKWKDDDKAQPPHWLQLDLGENYADYAVDHIDFLPRQNNNHGVVTKYNLSYSTDGVNYTPLVTEGTWDLAENGARPAQSVACGGVSARYFKLDCLDSIWSDYVFAAMAEANVFTSKAFPCRMTLPQGEGYTAHAEETEALVGGSLDFTVTLDSAYDQSAPVVKAGAAVLAPTRVEGLVYHYTVRLSDDVGITVENVVKNPCSIEIAADRTSVQVGGDVTVTVTAKGGQFVGAAGKLSFESGKFAVKSAPDGWEAIDENAYVYYNVINSGFYPEDTVLGEFVFTAEEQSSEVTGSFTLSNTYLADEWEDGWSTDDAEQVPNNGSVDVQITLAPAYEVEIVEDYVAGYSLVLVYTDNKAGAYTYDGKAMYDVTDAGYLHEGNEYTRVYGLVVKGMDADPGKVASAAESAGKLIYSTDVNGSNTTDLNDAVAVVAVYNANGMYLDAIHMDIVLKSDVNKNKKVDVDDFGLIKAEYTKQESAQ